MCQDMSREHPSVLFLPLAGLGIAATILLALWLRVEVVQPEALTWACAAELRPFWCGPRQLLLEAFNTGVIGAAALVASIAALIIAHPLGQKLALAGLVLSIFAFALYNAGAAAPAAVFALLRLFRSRG